MSDFRTKLLGLTSLAIAFAGVSYGQVTCTAGTPAPNNPTLRAEGETELVGDGLLGCTNAAGVTTGAVYVALSAPVTSKSLSGTGFGGNSEAVLQVIVAGTSVAQYPGTVTGQTVAFSGVSVPAGAFTLEASNIRVNASAANNPQVTETILLEFTGTGGVAQNAPGAAENVGYVLPTLGISILNSAGSVAPPATFTAFTTCAGNPIPGKGLTAPTANFTVNIKELVANAFKTLGGEGGSYPVTVSGGGLLAGTGVATQATQIQLAFANVPTAATLYLPIQIVSGGTTLSLVGSVTPVQSPAGLVGLVNAQGVFGFTPTNNTVTAVYTVSANTSTGTTFGIPGFVIFAPNATTPQAALTVLASYAPAATITALPTSIPTFAPSTATPSNLFAIVPCQTTLLFPYVTNYQGQYETGLAIANTTTDNLGTAGVSSATPTPGTCALNFYGNQAQPAQVTTPTIGAWSTATGSPSPIYATTLTAATSTTNFTGYAIALCNFNDAHGFAFIVDSSGTFSGTEGYVALVINGRPAADGGAGE